MRTKSKMKTKSNRLKDGRWTYKNHKRKKNKTTRTQIIEQNMNGEWDIKIRRKKMSDRIEPVSRVKALIPDDVILIRSGSLSTGRGIG